MILTSKDITKMNIALESKHKNYRYKVLLCFSYFFHINKNAKYKMVVFKAKYNKQTSINNALSTKV